MELFNWVTLVTGLLAGLGIGSVFTSFAQHFLKQKELDLKSRREDLERRYRVIILLMYAAQDFQSYETAIRIQRSDLKSKEDVIDELKAEWFNMLLFSSEQTQTFLHKFIEDPNTKNLKRAAISMRKDLGRGSLEESIIDLEFKR